MNVYKPTEYDVYRFWKKYAVEMRYDTSAPTRVTLYPYFMQDPIYMPFNSRILKNDYTRMQWCYSEIGNGSKANEIYYRHMLCNMDGAFGELVYKILSYEGDIDEIIETCGHEYPDDDPETRDVMYAIADKIAEECCSVELEECMRKVYDKFMYWRHALWGDGKLQRELDEYLHGSRSRS